MNKITSKIRYVYHSQMFKPFILIFAALFFGKAAVGQVDLAKAPLFTLKTAPGLVMLTMGRDITLYKAAYNDVTDLDGNGIPDLFYKPAFKYEGYFAYDRCYDYAAAGLFKPIRIGNVFVPDPTDTSKNYYKCLGGSNIQGKWSGNFLNWVSMSRMDVLRKVLYGGKRITDNTTTILERAFVPQDSTLWGKEYTSITNDGYDIREYTPLDLPSNAGTRHMFANVTLQKAPADKSAQYSKTVNPPVMIVYQNRPGRIWDLAAQEEPILGINPGFNPASSVTEGTTITQYNVRVETCTLLSGKYEDWCSPYVSSTGVTTYKPIGLLQTYGEAKKLAFGLISGTYDNNYGGGVLRQNIDDFSHEVNQSNGVFITSVKGIVHHLDSFRPWGFGDVPPSQYTPAEQGYYWGCGKYDMLPSNGDCASWGNPLGEIMFEGLRYFSGSTNPSPAFTNRVGVLNTSPEKSFNLDFRQPGWLNPYATVASGSRQRTAAYPVCARPVQLTIGDPKTSFDSDQLPGAAYSVGAGMGSGAIGSLGTLNVAVEADAIWASEFGRNVSKKFFIGESAGVKDGNPSAKTVTSFNNIRGHAPDSTTNEGSYYGASVARYGKYTGLTNPALPASQDLRVDQVSIALDSSTPQIKIPMGNGQIISLVVMSKTVAPRLPYNIDHAKGAFQQTGAITGFFFEKVANTNAINYDGSINGGRAYYKLRVSFSDSDQGADNESDAKATYEIKVLSTTELSVGMDYFNGTNGVELHLGYVIGGTREDGLYLDVGAGPWYSPPSQVPPMAWPSPTVGYFLDTLPGETPGSAMRYGTAPGYTNISTRLPQSTLMSPRVFKAGKNNNAEFIPHDMLWYAAKYGGATKNISGGFDFNLKPNGDPENYFFTSNLSQLSNQLGQAFQKAASLSGATSSGVTGNGVKIGGASLVYQANYDTVKWGGELSAFSIDLNGNVSNTATWKATAALPGPAARNIILGRGTNNKISIDTRSYSALNASEQTSFVDDHTFQYLLGVRTSEQSYPGGQLRNRSSAIGDIVNSDPLYISSTDFGYADASYQTFKTTSDPQLLGYGTNDGYYHFTSAINGVEKLAFIPLAARDRMRKLTNPAYDHEYYVDGPAAFGHVKWGPGSTPWKAVVASSMGAGGKSIFAFNVSPSTLSEREVLWEYADSANLGNVVTKPIIGMLEDGTTPAVIVGNGLNSGSDRASLIVVNAQTGTEIRTCKPTDAAGNSAKNGMGPTSFVSINNNGKINYVYGADYKGNIWRFDPNITGCDIQRIFTAKIGASVPQPITGELTIVKAPAAKSGYMILFGTGSYLNAADTSNIDRQSLYGIWDELTNTTVTGSNLNLQTILTPSTTAGTRTTSTSPLAWFEEPLSANKKGWYLDLSCSDATICPAGERSVAKPTLMKTGAAQRIFFLTYVPGTDPCEAGGAGWLTSLDPASGNFTNGFAKISQNGTYVPGVTPRGIFIVQRTPTPSNATTSMLFVNVNIGNKATPPAQGSASTGGKKIGSDGTGTGVVGFDLTGSTVTPGFGTRRQVWRQIQ